VETNACPFHEHARAKACRPPRLKLFMFAEMLPPFMALTDRIHAAESI
jgi:hypothetical protein